MKLKSILVILNFTLYFLGGITAEAGPHPNSIKTEQSTKKGVTVNLSSNGTQILIQMGKIKVNLPAIPNFDRSDLPADVNYDEFQKEFNSQYQALNEFEKINFIEKRLAFFKIVAEFFNGIKYGVTGLNWLIDGTKASSATLKENLVKLKNLSKDKISNLWAQVRNSESKTETEELQNSLKILEENQQNDQVEETPVLSAVSNKTKTDLITKTFFALNKIFYQNAKLVSQSVEFGFTIGLGISGNLGYKNDNGVWVIGGLSDLLLHISYRPATQTYILNLQSLNEVANNLLTKFSVVGGIDVRIGCHFKDGKEKSIIQGESSYPNNGVFGLSVYDDRVITWIVSEFNPFVLSDLSGFSTQGFAVNLLTLEGNKLYPLLFKAGRSSIFGQIFHLIKTTLVNVAKGANENLTNKCEYLQL